MDTHSYITAQLYYSTKICENREYSQFVNFGISSPTHYSYIGNHVHSDITPACMLATGVVNKKVAFTTMAIQFTVSISPCLIHPLIRPPAPTVLLKELMGQSPSRLTLK